MLILTPEQLITLYRLLPVESIHLEKSFSHAGALEVTAWGLNGKVKYRRLLRPNGEEA